MAFCITYDNSRKSLDLLAPNNTEQLRWARVLSYFILLNKKRKGILPEADSIMRNYFELADVSKDKNISESEISALLDSMNIKVKKETLKALIMEADSDSNGVLKEEELEHFLKRLYQRREILSIFKTFASDYMAADDFMTFLNDYQKENVMRNDCIKMIEKYEMDETNRNYARLSFGGFVNYLIDENQLIERQQNKVSHDMDKPIFCYYMNSSHNTYLSGDQLTSKSSADCYRSAIMNGARLVEMDVYDGPNNQPIIYHQKTLTSKIFFEEAIITCNEYAFKLSE